MTIIQPTQVKHKTKERNRESIVLTGSAVKKKQEKSRVEKFPELFQLSSETSSDCIPMTCLSPRREVPFVHHALSLNNKNFAKNKRSWLFYEIIELYCWKDLSQPKIRALSQSLDIFWRIARNSATSANGLDALGSWQGLSHRRLSTSWGLSSGTKQYKPIPSSAWKPDKGFLIAVPSPLTSWDIKLQFFKPLLTGHNSLTSGHTTSTPHTGNLPDWQHQLQCMESSTRLSHTEHKGAVISRKWDTNGH